MADRGAGRGVSWFVIGFLAGVAATLGVLIYGSVRSAQTIEASPRPRSAVVTYSPPKTMNRRLAEPALAGSSAPSAITAPPDGPDEQVREDAAAAGMTSRRVQPAVDLH
jgi:hypothetical protein